MEASENKNFQEENDVSDEKTKANGKQAEDNLDKTPTNENQVVDNSEQNPTKEEQEKNNLDKTPTNKEQEEKGDMSWRWLVLGSLCFFAIPLYVSSLLYVIRGKRPFCDKKDGWVKSITNIITFPISIPVWGIGKIKEWFGKKPEEVEEPVLQMQNVENEVPRKEDGNKVENSKNKDMEGATSQQVNMPQEHFGSNKGVDMNRPN